MDFKIEGIPFDHKNVNLYINFALKPNTIQKETHTVPPDDGERETYRSKDNGLK